MKKDKEAEAMIWGAAYAVAMLGLVICRCGPNNRRLIDEDGLDSDAKAIADRSTQTILEKLKEIETRPAAKP